MIYFYCILCSGKAFNGSVQIKQIEQILDVNKLIDEIYSNEALKEMNVTKENSAVISLSKL